MSIQIETIIRDETGREIRISKSYAGSLRLENLEAVESFMYQAKHDFGLAGERELLLKNQEEESAEKKKTGIT